MGSLMRYVLNTVESPLALNIVNSRAGISSYSFKICFLGTEYNMGLELTEKRFIVRLSLTAYPRDISNL